ncbi:ATP-binding protein [Falsiroseomonas oryzae]|uniref:ATP-binding protein n=1 Tax=Falsiroseomonas oryzae TaxID=2766473 RepID=UPI0022EA7C38|nr:ATP-binding protein [Roseomonas sp. MO-31]
MAMVLTDARRPDHPIVFANQAFLDLTGYAEAEVVGRNCRFMQCPWTDAAAVRQMREALDEERPVAVEILNRRRDGSLFWNAVFIAPVFGPDGAADYFFASQIDITQRHEADEALHKAQRLEAVAQLAAGLAHDFNNALHVVLGNLGRVETRLADEQETRRALDRARRGGEYAAALTRQLLAFARRSRLQPRAVALNATLSHLGEALARAAGGETALRYDLDPLLPPCMVDLAELEAALLNLLTNARDATPSGGCVTVRTRTTNVERRQSASAGGAVKPGTYAELVVEDDGQGMTPEVLARAAEPFFTTKPGRGVGLGLATVHGFARQSGGHIEIESTPGHGTTVRLFLPALPAGGTEPGEAAPPARGPAAAGATILVVDDAADVLDLAVHHLTALGYRVLAARSGEEALAMLTGTDRTAVDLLFSDIAMPGGMNGLMLAERARGASPGLRVLFATGYSEDLATGSAPAIEAPVLAKPYAESDLAAAVADALRSTAGTPEPQSGGPPASDGAERSMAEPSPASSAGHRPTLPWC